MAADSHPGAVGSSAVSHLRRTHALACLALSLLAFVAYVGATPPFQAAFGVADVVSFHDSYGVERNAADSLGRSALGYDAFALAAVMLADLSAMSLLGAAGAARLAGAGQRSPGDLRGVCGERTSVSDIAVSIVSRAQLQGE